MSGKVVSLKERRRQREEKRSLPPEENPNLVPCARCGAMILMTSTRCPECGVHFLGQALEFTHPSEQAQKTGSSRGWVLLIVVMTLLAFILGSMVWR